MNAVTQVAESRQLTPIKEFQQQVEQREVAFASSLPAHIPPERFKRVVLRAVQKAPELLAADRASLLSSAMDAANDGLMPDGREGAMVVYNTKIKRDGKDVWIKKVQWMPMIFGILKKIRNSGELKSIAVRMVYGGDSFRYWIDENGEHIQYEAADNPDKTIFRRAFAIALTKDDGRYIEVMDAEDIEKVRSVSRAKDRGPWVDWWEEMAKKTVLRRMAKRLPMSTDLDDLMRRDDALYNFDEARARPHVEAPKMLNDRLNVLADMRSDDAGETDGDDEDADPETGEIVEPDEASQKGGKKAAAEEQKTEPGENASNPTSGSASDGKQDVPSSASAAKPSSGASPSPGGGTTSQADARAAGADARDRGMSRKAVPAEYRKEPLLTAFLEGFDTGIAEDREPGADG